MKMNSENYGKILYLRIEKINGQRFLTLLSKFHKDGPVIDKKFNILKEQGYILFPLIENEKLKQSVLELIISKINYEIVYRDPEINTNYFSHSILEELKKRIPEEYLDLVPKSYDIIGKIGIIEFEPSSNLLSEKILEIKKEIAKALIMVNRNIETVFEKISEVKGEYRLRELKLLEGKENSETFHKENGCKFKVDVMKTFFTPRLSFERNRLASLNFEKNEIIADLFAGVGPFSIEIAKKQDVRIYSFDSNINAYNYMKENIALNNLTRKVIPHHLDVRELTFPKNEIGNKLKNTINRIIMNLPERSLDYIDVACFLIKKTGGIIHNYQFCEKPNPIEKAINNLNDSLEKVNWTIEKLFFSKIVKSFSPKLDLIVLDVKIKENKM